MIRYANNHIRGDTVLMAKTGRKCKYETHVKPRLKEIGYMREQDGYQLDVIAGKLGISLASLMRYQIEFCDLRQQLKKSKEIQIQKSVDSLFNRGQGYEWTETKTVEETIDGPSGITTKTNTTKTNKFTPPDTGALMAFLKKSAPDVWADKIEIPQEMQLLQVVEPPPSETPSEDYGLDKDEWE